MSAVADRKAALAEALLAAAGGADWGGSGRAAARDRFSALGAPVKRDEYWRFSDPQRLTEPMAPSAPAAAAAPAEDVFSGVAPLRIVFANGVFDAAASDDLSASGLEIAPIEAALVAESGWAWAEDAFGALESAGQSPAPRPLAALNGAAATSGVAIRATGSETCPVLIEHRGSGEGAAHLRHVVRVEAGAALTLLETGIGAARLNTVLEAEIADDARLDHVRLQVEPNLDQAATHLFARLGAAANLKSFTLTATRGGAKALVRNECVLWLEGDGGSAHVAGGMVGSGDAHLDSTVFLTHGAENCESRQVYKTVLDDAAEGVFQGKILVREGAQKTDGYQISQTVLLKDGASFQAKPELEIYADDVKCSHGSTTGALDETALFYLRSRGVPERVAQAMLIEAFLEEAIAEIADERLQDVVRDIARRFIGADGA